MLLLICCGALFFSLFLHTPWLQGNIWRRVSPYRDEPEVLFQKHLARDFWELPVEPAVGLANWAFIPILQEKDVCGLGRVKLVKSSLMTSICSAIVSYGYFVSLTHFKSCTKPNISAGKEALA